LKLTSLAIERALLQLSSLLSTSPNSNTTLDTKQKTYYSHLTSDIQYSTSNMPAPSKARIEAIAKQLAPKPEAELPAILKFAGPSNGPRMKGLVTIITGPFKVSRAPPLPCPVLSDG
jgi:hypothetical protein